MPQNIEENVLLLEFAKFRVFKQPSGTKNKL